MPVIPARSMHLISCATSQITSLALRSAISKPDIIVPRTHEARFSLSSRTRVPSSLVKVRMVMTGYPVSSGLSHVSIQISDSDACRMSLLMWVHMLHTSHIRMEVNANNVCLAVSFGQRPLCCKTTSLFEVLPVPQFFRSRVLCPCPP